MENKTIFRVLSIILLLINGIPALLAGGILIADPTGAGLKMDLSLLEFAPFKTFLVPGIVLFTMNGVLSLVTLSVLLMKKQYYPLLLTCQGAILTGWIIIQVIMIKDTSLLQPMYGITGLILMAAGVSLEYIQNDEKDAKRLQDILSLNDDSIKGQTLA